MRRGGSSRSEQVGEDLRKSHKEIKEAEAAVNALTKSIFNDLKEHADNGLPARGQAEVKQEVESAKATVQRSTRHLFGQLQADLEERGRRINNRLS